METLMMAFRSGADKSWRWFEDRAHGAHAKFWLFFFSFTESSFFIISPDVLLVAILMVGAERWVYYASITTIASVLGGVFGYIIGVFFYDAVGQYIITFYSLEEDIQMVGSLFGENTFWVIFLAAFTPIPYKVFVLAGGFFGIPFVPFLIASTLGRGLRFFLVAYVMKLFGRHMARVFLRYFTIISLAFVALLVVYLGSYFKVF